MKSKMQRKGFSTWEILGGFALIVLAAFVVYPMTSRPRETVRRNGCPQNLKQVGIALMQYQVGWGERVPPIALSATVSDSKIPYYKQPAYGWADALHPYLKSMEMYKCPMEENPNKVFPQKTNFTDYWLNSNVASKKLMSISARAQSITFGDGNDGNDLTNARYNLPALPATWIKDPKSPVYRHKGMANYAFLDGHVKALPPDQITNEPSANGKPTFAVK